MAKSTVKPETFYLIHYRDPKEGQIVALKAMKIEDSTLGLSFVKISDFIFNTSGVVVQPTEEQLKKRFENVQSLHLSIYSLISIEELGMEHQGLTFRNDRSNLISFPTDHSPIM
ncbi:MAG: DUF1820 family protein [Bdellovibrionales bacterium]|nr:DUF1820 family protein [Bdellovibrionales bacterium]